MRVSALRYAIVLLATRKLIVLRFLLTSLLRSSLFLAGTLLIREFLSGVLGEERGLAHTFAHSVGADAALWLVAVLLLSTFLGASLVSYDNHVVQQRIIKTLELGFMDRVIRHLLKLSVSFVDQQSHGDIIQALRQDVTNLRTVVMSLAALVFEGALAIGLLGSLFWLSPDLAIWMVLVLPPISIPILLASRQLLIRSHGIRRSGFLLLDAILQILRGVRLIRVFQGEERETEAVMGKAGRFFDELITMVRIQALAQVLLEALAGLSIVVVIIIGGYEVMDGSLDWPTLMAFLIAMRALQGPLNSVNSHILEIRRHGAAVQRLSELLSEYPEVKDLPTAEPLIGAPRRFTFSKVHFKHAQRLILSGLDFEVEAGETIGIVGPSGAGKTTLLSLVARFYDPTSGAIYIDDRDLREFQLKDVYENLSIVTQEPFLFTATIRENIRCGCSGASDIEVENAARIAGIHDEILDMPVGYDTLVGVSGRGVSAGQAQRINVARAILKKAPILLLDEATSSLDSITEVKVQRAIDGLIEGSTTFIVAHRLSTLRNASRILVLEAGKCVGFDSHERLLQDCPLYQAMWNAQQHGVVREEAVTSHNRLVP